MQVTSLKTTISVLFLPLSPSEASASWHLRMLRASGFISKLCPLTSHLPWIAGTDLDLKPRSSPSARGPSPAACVAGTSSLIRTKLKLSYPRCSFLNLSHTVTAVGPTATRQARKPGFPQVSSLTFATC